MNQPGPVDVAIVGAGWAGLSAAVACIEQGLSVSLFEASREPGGRARRVMLDGLALDNGQHLFIGAYRETLRLMAAVGVSPEQAFDRRGLELALSCRERRFRLHLPRHAGPAALALALLRAEGPRLADRVRCVLGAGRLRTVPGEDQDVERWLAHCRQPESLRDLLWRPLCLAALNVPAHRASARVFARVLSLSFGQRGGSDLLLARSDLGALFPDAAVAWLRARDTDLRLGARVRRIAPGPPGSWSVATRDSTQGACHVVLAADPTGTRRLLPRDGRLASLRGGLEQLGAEPITTVYLRYPEHVALERPMTGRLDGPAQWLFDRGETGQPGVIAAVISGRGEHDEWSREALGSRVAAQLRAAHPDWPAPRAIEVIREKRATFDCRPGIDALRSGPATGVPGLWLAGDHVATGLPATIESAVRAGRAAAQAIHETQAVTS